MPPPFIAVGAITKAITSKRPQTKLKYAAETAAFGFGIPWSQPYRTIKGAIDLATGKTTDPRRLVVSEFVLRSPGEGKKVSEDITKLGTSAMK